MKKFITLILAVAGYVGTASATDYYIGANTLDNGSNWAIQGQMTDEDGDGIYSLTIQVPVRVYVSDGDDYFTKFYFTIFTSSTIDWNCAYRPTNGETWFSNNVAEIELSTNASLNEASIGYGNSYEDDANKNFASALKLDFDPSTMKLKATRLIAVITANNNWSTSTDYLTETSNGSKIYSGNVSITTSGFKFYLHEKGWEYYGRNGGSGYIVNTTGDNVTVAEDGLYSLTAHLSDFVWQDPILLINVSAGTYGMATFSSTHALDFTGITDVSVYTITAANKATGELTKSPVTGQVAASTGLYIEGEANASAYVPVTTYDTAADGNMLVGVNSEISSLSQTTGDNTNYILTVNSANGNVAPPKFFKVNTAGNTVPAGKAYLQIPTASAAREFFWFGEDATAIDAVEQNATVDGTAYNLAGQRVAQPTRGLYIVNGKKVIVK